MIHTDGLFTFELDMDAGTTGEQLEELVYNCLDFCLMNRRQAHFFLMGEDAVHHPALWRLLGILREENATFSLLSEPERSAFVRQRSLSADTEDNKVHIRTNGDVYCGPRFLGSAAEDRLADLWVCAGMGEGKRA